MPKMYVHPKPEGRSMKYKLWFPKDQKLMLMGQSPTHFENYECVFEGEITNGSDMFAAPHQVLDMIWQRHNVGDNGDGNRPRPYEIRSMCVGDIVEFDNPKEFWMPEFIGWVQLGQNELPVFKK